MVEEKIDGSEASLYFTDDLDLVVATRGERAPRNGNFNPLRLWADTHADMLFDVLETRYVMFGQWAHLKHTVFYDTLPALPFLEEDVYDRQGHVWLSTPARHTLLEPLQDFLHSVPVRTSGFKTITECEKLPSFVGRSTFQSPVWQGRLLEEALRLGIDADQVRDETDMSGRMEGLYIKVEDGGQVIERYKWVRWEFLQAILRNDRHWKARRALPNLTRGT